MSWGASALVLLLAAGPTQQIDRALPQSARCDDLTFLRRAALDLLGRLPSPQEIQRFTEDPRSNKRDHQLRAWLKHEDAAAHFATVWGRRLIGTERGRQVSLKAFESWLANAYREDLSWAQLMRQLLTASGRPGEVGAVNYISSRISPEALTGDTARLFLGSSLSCAQCHDHPYEEVSQRDFFAVQAYFARTYGKRNIYDSAFGDARVPQTSQAVAPRFWLAPKTGAPPGPSGEDRRRALADAIEAHPNFARAIINRTWAQLLGRGLTPNLDELNEGEASPSRSLLERLAKDAGALSPQKLHLAIMRSGLYQSPAQTDFVARPMNAEQLLGALQSATGHPLRRLQGRRATKRKARVLQQLDRAHGVQKPGERPRATVTKALLLLNGPRLKRAIASRQGAVRQVLSRWSQPEERARQLFLRTLSRPPDPGELAKVVPMLKGRDRFAYEDLMWALLSGPEFSYVY